MSATAWTPEERRERGTLLCQRLANDVGSLAPPGLGTWPRTWDLVAGADAAFMIALTAWEAEPSERLRLRVREAYDAVLDAWRQAAAEYLAHRGSPR